MLTVIASQGFFRPREDIAEAGEDALIRAIRSEAFFRYMVTDGDAIKGFAGYGLLSAETIIVDLAEIRSVFFFQQVLAGIVFRAATFTASFAYSFKIFITLLQSFLVFILFHAGSEAKCRINPALTPYLF